MENILKLSELVLLVKETIDLAFGEYYYIIAEINQITVNKKSGHAYLELIEKDNQTNQIIAKIKGIIWNRDYKILNAFFKHITGDDLKAGIKVLLKGYVNFNQVYGLSFIITNIDPNYTLGDLALQKQQVIEQLQKDGIIDLNKKLPFPLVPQRIAIISSATAAGLEDFIKHLNNNSYGYKFSYQLFEAIMQGDETENSIISALNDIYQVVENFDVVVIIRGGGSKFDLTAFDSYKLAANIAQFPLPVLTGIGHQRDLSVVDLVAYQHLKTPTAVADFLIEKLFEFELILKNLKEQLFSVVSSFLENTQLNLSSLLLKLKNTSSDYFLKFFDQLTNLKSQLKQASDVFFYNKFFQLNQLKNIFYKNLNAQINWQLRFLEKLKNKILTEQKIYFFNQEKILDLLKQKMDNSNPYKILQKGFTLTLKNGKPISSVNEIQKNDIIETIFSDGKIKSKVQ